MSLDARDRKSTRLNSSHANISYAVFCLKKKKLSVGVEALLMNKRSRDMGFDFLVAILLALIFIPFWHLSAVRLTLRRLEAVFLFKDTETTEIYTLSLHDALPI